MPSGTYKQVYVKCPFYHYDENMKITCEGVIPGSSLRTIFHSPTVYSNYMKLYCSNRYNDCPIAKLIDDQYDEEGRRCENALQQYK